MSRTLALLHLAVCAHGTYLLTDAPGLGPPFQGLGAISGGGATSRLLLDYVEPQRSEILDYLFLPGFGASLQILKLEIGGSCDSTNGAEAPHRYTAEEAPNFERGYEFWLLTEALKRNAAIRVYGLPWCFPAFIGNGSTLPFGPGTSNGALAAAFVTEWAVAARDVYNASVWALGLFNEKPSTPQYILTLRAALDAAGLGATHIVASDEGGWPGAAQVLANASVARAVGLLGAHYPGASSSAQARQTGLPLLASEDNSRSCLPDANGGACWARAINENAVHANISGSISWSLINSWYDGIEFFGDGLMSAVQPWSGSYYVGAPIWASAHTTHHTAPGWHYLQAGAGVGYLAGGGTYVTFLSPDATQATLVIEKLDRGASQCSWSSNPPNVTSNETAQFLLQGSLAGITQLHVLRSRFDARGAADPETMYQSEGLVPVVGGVVTVDVAVNDLITLSTVASSKGAHPAPPSPAPFPPIYAPNFDAVALAQEPAYLSDVRFFVCCAARAPAPCSALLMSLTPLFFFLRARATCGPQQMNGNFEVVDAAPYQRPGYRVLRQMTPAKPILWLRSDTTPHAIVGDPAWADTNASTDVFLPLPSDTAALGLHCHGLDVDATACVWLRVTAAGGQGGGSWALYMNARDMANASTTPKAGGALPLPAAQWHSVTLSSVGGNLSGAVNGVLLFSNLSAASLGGSAVGFVGLGTAAYGHFSVFDHLAVSAIAPPPPPPPPPPASCDALFHSRRRRWWRARSRNSSSDSGSSRGSHHHYHHHPASAGAAPPPAASCTPTAGTLLRTSPCGAGGDGLAWVWSAGGGSSQGTLSPANDHSLCAAVNASRLNKQTGAPQVEVQACMGGGAPQQQWSAPPAHGATPGSIGTSVAGRDVALEVTKNEPGKGVPLEVWGSNGGANQQWCTLKSGEIMTLLDDGGGEPMCIGACVA